MQIVPVIDLMDGRVVHARRGDRANYRPLESVLTASSEPLTVVRALLQIAPFTAIYVADLDAILHRRNHSAVVRELVERFAPLEVWLDAGFGEVCDVMPWHDADRIVPVIGSESLAAEEDLTTLLAVAPQAVLSLDTRDGMPLGPPALFAQPQRWPEHVIVMTLDKVGATSGPAVERLRATAALAPDRRLIAAGGVRDAADLDSLAAMKVHAVLVATAIHDGTLGRDTLQRFVQR